MNTICTVIESDGSLHSVAEDEALSGWRQGRGVYWIDLEGGTVSDMIAWCAGLGLDPTLLDLMQTGGHANKVLPLDNAVYFEYPVIVMSETATVETFTCLCLKGLVISMHERPVMLSKLAATPAPDIKMQEATTSSLVCTMIILQTTWLRRYSLELRDRAVSLAERMDDDQDAVALAEIVALKREVVLLDGVASDQLATFDILQAVDKPPLNLAGLPEIFQIALGNTRATDRSVDRLESSARDLQRRFEASQQDKTNQRLAVLTILSAIFSPLTLLAGIYGMNFDHMPELHLRYGYYFALGGMILLAGGLYWFLKTRGWLK